MKSYTDLKQSEKLAEILPVKSADMKWFVPADNEGEFIEEVSLINNKSEYNLFDKVTDWNDTPYVPCWSLAALLYVASKEVSLNSFKDGDWNVMVQQNGRIIYNDADNPIDACYEMILKLHELKIL